MGNCCARKLHKDGRRTATGSVWREGRYTAAEWIIAASVAEEGARGRKEEEEREKEEEKKKKRDDASAFRFSLPPS